MLWLDIWLNLFYVITGWPDYEPRSDCDTHLAGHQRSLHVAVEATSGLCQPSQFTDHHPRTATRDAMLVYTHLIRTITIHNIDCLYRKIISESLDGDARVQDLNYRFDVLK